MPVQFTLDDAEERNREHPDTFEIPNAEVRENLSIGDIVKLIFCIDVDGVEQVERMWVEVVKVKAKSYDGKLQSHSLCSPDLRCGVPVRFGAKHVIQVWQD